MMDNIRKHEESKLERTKHFIPMNFNEMLNHRYKQMQHQNIAKEIAPASLALENENYLD